MRNIINLKTRLNILNKIIFYLIVFDGVVLLSSILLDIEYLAIYSVLAFIAFAVVVCLVIAIEGIYLHSITFTRLQIMHLKGKQAIIAGIFYLFLAIIIAWQAILIYSRW